MPTLADFYADPDVADGFGATKGRVRPHRGLDYPHASGTPIPAWAGGVVVVNQWSAELGWVLVIQVSDKVFAGYCHLKARSPHPVRSLVKKGEIVGPVGTTGTASLGNHLHATVGPNGQSVFQGTVYDPLPYITAAIGSSVASLDTTDLPGKKKLMSTLIRNYDGSIGLVTEDGELVPLASMNEVESLKATGLVGDYAQMADGNVWNTLTSITARKVAQRAATDPSAIAAHVAPLVVSAVLASLQGVAGITQAQVEQAAEKAIRTVFADAAK